MVAFLVFFLALPAVTGAFLTAYSTTAKNRDGVLAADLLSQTLDGVRSVPFADLSVGTTTSTQTVDGTTFTVNQTVEATAPPEQSTDVCGASTTGTGNDDYLLVSIAITWLNSAGAVRGQTMLAPPATLIASGDADVIIEVFSADGNAAVGVPVTINSTPSETVTTNSNGCASFPYLAANQSYTLTATGYVNTSQLPASITTPVLALNQTYEQTTGITWDLATTLDGPVQAECITGVGPVTYSVCPSTTDVIYPTSCTAGASPCSSAGAIPVVFVPNGSPSARVIAGATGPGTGNEAATTGFPFLTNYQAWAGTCADAAPASGFVEGLTAVPNQTALIWPSNPNITLFGQVVTSSAYGKTVTVTHAADSDCSSGETYSYSVPSSKPSGDNAIALAVPAGTNWTFRAGSDGAVPGQSIPPTSMSGLAL
jgi:hypothetical protein